MFGKKSDSKKVTIHATGLQGPSCLPVVSSSPHKPAKNSSVCKDSSSNNDSKQRKPIISLDQEQQCPELLQCAHVNEQAASLLEDSINIETNFFSVEREAESPENKRVVKNWTKESDFHEQLVPFLTARQLQEVANDSARRRKVARKGLPASQRCQIWQKFILINCQKQKKDVCYEEKVKQLFASTKGVLPHTVKPPDFGSPVRFRHGGGTPIMENVQRMLCVLAADFPSLSYCVPLVDLVFLLLLHMPINTAYVCVSAIIERSLHDGFYLPTSHNAFARFVMTFGQLLREKAGDLHEHIVRVGIDIDACFLSWVSRLFVSFLPLPKICRMLDVFFLEGKNILFNYPIYLLERYARPLQNYKNVKDLMSAIEIVLFQSPFHLLDKCFQLNFGTTRLTSLENSHTTLVRTPLPRVKGFRVPTMQHSDLVDAIECVRLWEWLPPSLSARDPTLIFSSTTDGCRLQSLLHAMDKHEGREFILLVQDMQRNVCGLVLFQTWNNRSTLQGADGFDLRTFMFTLRPRCHRYVCMKDPANEGDSSDDEKDDTQKTCNVMATSSPVASTLSTSAPQSLDSPALCTELNPKFLPNEPELLSGAFSALSCSSSSPSFLRKHDAEWKPASDSAIKNNVPKLFMRRHTDFLAVGDENGIVFALDNCLQQGVSQQSVVFRNPFLSPTCQPDTGLFAVLGVELWGFQSPFLHTRRDGDEIELESIDTMRERHNSLNE